jgi:hypothetical protein
LLVTTEINMLEASNKTENMVAMILVLETWRHVSIENNILEVGLIAVFPGMILMLLKAHLTFHDGLLKKKAEEEKMRD